MQVWKARNPQVFNSGLTRVRREVQKLALRFLALSLAELAVLRLMKAHLHYLVMATYFFWLPQIIANVSSGVSKAIRTDYIVGVSTLRMSISLYFYLCPVNFMALDPRPTFCLIIGTTIAVQAVVLLLQDYLGTRWFVPPCCLPRRYNYHRPLPVSGVPRVSCPDCPAVDEADGDQEREDRLLLAGETALTAASETQPVARKRDRDREVELPSMPSAAIDIQGAAGDEEEGETCPICYVVVEARSQVSALMVTPCNHVFHTACLMQWMEHKMECPTCRRPLPSP